MTWLHALILGIVEGLTEFLPVSSTGHLWLLGALLGHDDGATKAIEIVMQLGAVVAVVIFYRARLWELSRGILARDPSSLRLMWALACGFLPVVVIGLPFHHAIEEVLMAPLPIAGALIVGGVVMVISERVRRRGHPPEDGDPGEDGLDKVTTKRALIIGFAQCFSLWPGASRSMSTIVGGQLSGLNTATAADFSFFLSIPTLGAATLFALVKHRHEIAAAPGGTVALGVSTLTSFVVAFVVIAAFLRYLKRTGLAPFGWYRIGFGGLVVFLFFFVSLRGPEHAPDAVTAGAASTAGSARARVLPAASAPVAEPAP
jgi:undecaprenyl-diphosphatase